mmetsp:Transcript_73440/g.201702  ORF Transcript_73440/g.201702 Transcript_73440/m.201702 type:complete len:285 (-) Transcript_73440:72-926(-)
MLPPPLSSVTCKPDWVTWNWSWSPGPSRGRPSAKSTRSPLSSSKKSCKPSSYPGPQINPCSRPESDRTRANTMSGPPSSSSRPESPRTKFPSWSMNPSSRPETVRTRCPGVTGPPGGGGGRGGRRIGSSMYLSSEPESSLHSSETSSQLLSSSSAAPSPSIMPRLMSTACSPPAMSAISLVDRGILTPCCCSGSSIAVAVSISSAADSPPPPGCAGAVSPPPPGCAGSSVDSTRPSIGTLTLTSAPLSWPSGTLNVWNWPSGVGSGICISSFTSTSSISGQSIV